MFIHHSTLIRNDNDNRSRVKSRASRPSAHTRQRSPSTSPFLWAQSCLLSSRSTPSTSSVCRCCRCLLIIIIIGFHPATGVYDGKQGLIPSIYVQVGGCAAEGVCPRSHSLTHALAGRIAWGRARHDTVIIASRRILYQPSTYNAHQDRTQHCSTAVHS